jgi:hypothetical protein
MSSDEVGLLHDELREEMWIWRPIMARLVTLDSVKSGEVNIEDLLKLNALLDMKDAIRLKAQSEHK